MTPGRAPRRRLQAVRAKTSKSNEPYTVSHADKAALERLLLESTSGLSLHNEQCAQLIIALAYPGVAPPVNLACWALKLPERLIADIASVFHLSLRLQSSLLSFESLGMQLQIRRVVEHWYPEALGLPPATPRPSEIAALRSRFHLSRWDLATLLFVEEVVIEQWESGRVEMPIPLWQALKILVSNRGLARGCLAMNGQRCSSSAS